MPAAARRRRVWRPLCAGGAARRRGGDRRRCPPRSRADAGAGGGGECGDRSGAWGLDRVQYLADRYGGGDWACVVITRLLLLDLDAFYLEDERCGDLEQ